MSPDPRSHQAEDSRSLACTAVRAPWGPGSPLHTHAWARDKPSPASGFGVLSPGLYSFLITPQPPELPGRARGPWTRWTETHLRTRDGKADPPPTASAPPTAHVTRGCASGPGGGGAGTPKAVPLQSAAPTAPLRCDRALGQGFTRVVSTELYAAVSFRRMQVPLPAALWRPSDIWGPRRRRSRRPEAQSGSH